MKKNYNTLLLPETLSCWFMYMFYPISCPPCWLCVPHHCHISRLGKQYITEDWMEQLEQSPCSPHLVYHERRWKIISPSCCDLLCVWN